MKRYFCTARQERFSSSERISKKAKSSSGYSSVKIPRTDIPKESVGDTLGRRFVVLVFQKFFIYS